MKLKIFNKRVSINIAVIVIGYFVWCNVATFNVDKATKHLTENALSKSHNCCAWFTMRAMQSGGCPSVILPAWAYEYYLPTIGWKEIKEKSYTPQKGDICVFPFKRNHIFGHIAMWNGEQWISDFKQNSIIVSSAYSDYKIFRHKTVTSYSLPEQAQSN
ncbi:MAG: CHAP domain-containing protein [Duncaniella sp.]|nr:CHAP domain-containing protein [Duncaniella sp.]